VQLQEKVHQHSMQPWTACPVKRTPRMATTPRRKKQPLQDSTYTVKDDKYKWHCTVFMAHTVTCPNMHHFIPVCHLSYK
jgi:hypothetical protein